MYSGWIQLDELSQPEVFTEGKVVLPTWAIQLAHKQGNPSCLVNMTGKRRRNMGVLHVGYDPSNSQWLSYLLVNLGPP